MGVSSCEYPKKPYLATKQKRSDSLIANPGFKPMFQEFAASLPFTLAVNPEKPDVPLNKNDAFQKVQKRRVQEKR